MNRPAPDEYADFYAGYIAKVPDGDILELLTAQLAELTELLSELPSERQDYRYAPGKWSVKEMLGHLVDAERIFSYRALSIARGDTQPLPGMDQDGYAAGTDFDARSFESLLEEFRHLRQANLLLFASFDGATLQRRGTASGNPFSVRALIHVTAGHVQHHIDQLRLRYLSR